MTREGRENREIADFLTTANGYERLFAALFKTAFTVQGIKTEDAAHPVTSSYIIGVMYERGGIAYDITTGLWLPFSERDRDAMGNAQSVELYGQDGTRYTRDRKDVYIFRANPDAFAWCGLIRLQCAKLADIDNAIKQNLDAVKEMTILLSDNEALSRGLQLADAKRRAGASVAVLSPRMLGMRDEAAAALAFQNVQTLKTEAEYKADRLRIEWKEVYEHTLHLIGIHTSKSKGERKTDDEIQSENGESNAFAAILYNTANDDAKAQNAPFAFVLRESGEAVQNTDKNEETPYNATDGVEMGVEE